MGTTCSRVMHIGPSSSLDYGTLNPYGIYSSDTDYDAQIVRALIRKGQLAPFYQGSNDICMDNDMSYETECPICFLFYPSKMNRTRCCDKSICTECFLQLRRSSSSPLVPAVCPFCVQPNFGVLYIPPVWSKHYTSFKKRRSDLFKKNDEMDRRKWRVEPTDPDVVLVDTVRPRWEEMLEERRASSVGTTRRRRVQLNNGERRRTRQPTFSLRHDNGSNNTIYDSFADMDLEDVLVMEAIRLSLVNSNNNTTTTNTTTNN